MTTGMKTKEQPVAAHSGTTQPIDTATWLQQHLAGPVHVYQYKYSPLTDANMSYESKATAQQIVCMDETRLSVQASEHHYCRPRRNVGPYTCVEVGFPSAIPPDSWAPFAEMGGKHPTDNVYAYIPISMVVEYINYHGGVDHDRMLANRVIERMLQGETE